MLFIYNEFEIVSRSILFYYVKVVNVAKQIIKKLMNWSPILVNEKHNDSREKILSLIA